MDKLSETDFKLLRLFCLKNAEDLLEEAEILLNHEKWARTYFLAHSASEEIGKFYWISLAKIIKFNNNDLNRLIKKTRSHKEKIIYPQLVEMASVVRAHHGNGEKFDEEMGKLWDLLEEAEHFEKMVTRRSRALYVDVVDGKIILPSEEISPEHARAMYFNVKGRLKFAELYEQRLEQVDIISV